MAIYSANDVSSEGVVNRALLSGSVQVPAGTVMVIGQQYTAGAAITNTTTETSVLTTALFSPGLSGNAGVSPGAITIPAGGLYPGLQGRVKFFATITNTGTPTLRTRLVLRNTTGTIAYTLSDTTATATSAITGTREYVAEFDFMTAAVGATGSVIARGSHTYGTSATANTTVKAASAAVTVDTTQQYTLDLLVTWGAASASNTITPQFGSFEVL